MRESNLSRDELTALVGGWCAAITADVFGCGRAVQIEDEASNLMVASNRRRCRRGIHYASVLAMIRPSLICSGANAMGRSSTGQPTSASPTPGVLSSTEFDAEKDKILDT